MLEQLTDGNLDSATSNHNNGSCDKMDDKLQRAHTWSAYFLLGRQSHLLCRFSQQHVHSAEEVDVLFSAIKLLSLFFVLFF